MLRKTILTAVTSLSLITVASAVIEEGSPEYSILKESDGVQLRVYPPYIVAEVDVKAENRREASSMGFGPLASYIFGRNRPGEKIAMTSPVVTEPMTSPEGINQGDGAKIAMTSPVTTAENENGIYTVRFSMPKEWTMETLPKPENDRVRIVKTPERKLVAAGYTGPRDVKMTAKLNAKLDAFAADNDIVLSPGMITAGYDGPRTPAAKRRWEVMREVVAD